MLVERLAALEWPELVLLARWVTGSLQKAAAAWLEAVRGDAKKREAVEHETGQSPDGADARASESPRSEGMDGVQVSVRHAETPPRIAEEALPQHSRRHSAATWPTPVQRPSPGAERVYPVAVGMQAPAPAPGASAGPEIPSPGDRVSAPRPTSLAARRGEVPSATAGETGGAAEEHEPSATRAPAVGSTPRCRPARSAARQRSGAPMGHVPVASRA